MSQQKDGCVKPAAGPILPSQNRASAEKGNIQEVDKVLAQVGKEAIDFEANAFFAGRRFQNSKTLRL